MSPEKAVDPPVRERMSSQTFCTLANVRREKENPLVFVSVDEIDESVLLDD